MPNPTAIVPIVLPAPDFRTLTPQQIAAAAAVLDTTPYVSEPLFPLKNGDPPEKGMAFRPFTLAAESLLKYRLAVGPAQANNDDQYVCMWALSPSGSVAHRVKVMQGTVARGAAILPAGTGCLAFGLGWDSAKHRISKMTAGAPIPGNPALVPLVFTTGANHGVVADGSGNAVLAFDRTPAAALDGVRTVSITGHGANEFGLSLTVNDYNTLFAAGLQLSGYWRLTDESAQLSVQLGCCVTKIQ